jgi:peptide-methionine (R)-S-oxide reductase
MELNLNLLKLFFSLVGLLCFMSASAAGQKSNKIVDRVTGEVMEVDKLKKTEEEWKKELTPEQYEVLRKKGTEKPFTGKYCSLKQKGMYKCAACGLELFSSDAKFDSGTGWPSFSEPVQSKNIALEKDASHFRDRTEVKCPRCGGHLGHVFDDGPTASGKRFCINSAALQFESKELDKK